MPAVLTPGTHLLRRSRTEAQAGLHAEHAVRFTTGPDWDPSARRAWDDVPPSVLAHLLDGGTAVRDDHALRAALPPAVAGPGAGRRSGSQGVWPRHAVAALFRSAPEQVHRRMTARSTVWVTVTTFGHPLAADLGVDLERLCRRAGLPMAADRPPGPPRKDAVTPRPVHVVVGVGEPRRELLDPLVRDEVPHLLVRLVEGDAVVGPFVEPGRTACLRCLDAHRTARDPAWPLLVEQYARAGEHDRPDGIPEPVDPALAALTVAWAVRDLATWAGGDRPATAGSTLRVSAGLETIEAQAWPTHPSCGCVWAAA